MYVCWFIAWFDSLLDGWLVAWLEGWLVGWLFVWLQSRGVLPSVVCLSVMVKPRKLGRPRPPRGCRAIGRKNSLVIKGLIWIKSDTFAVPWLVADLSTRRPGFDAGSFHVGFVVDKVALGQVFPPPSTSVFPYQFHSTGAPLLGKRKKEN
jgi:hypothetical protein